MAMSNVVNLAEYRKRKQDEAALEEDLDELRRIHGMSREEIALLITHMFNDETDLEITDDVNWHLDDYPNYDLDSFTYTVSLTSEEEEEPE
jgi:hypothetical protein